MRFIKEEIPIWDNEKESIFDKVELGTFELNKMEIGGELNQEWWKLIDEDEIVLGFGWVNLEDGDFEVSLVVDKDYQRRGLGTLIIEEFERIAKEEGFRKIKAIIKLSNPNSITMLEWLYKKGYEVYIPGIDGMVPQTKEVATNMVKKMDTELLKGIL